MRTIVILLFGLLVSSGVMAVAEDEPAKNAGDAGLPPAVVKTVAVKAAAIPQSVTGIANVLSPDTLIQLDADIRAAQIAVDFSRREYERYKSTKSLSIHIIESAQRQSETADAQLAVLQLRLRQAWGDTSPFLKDEQRPKIVEELSSGKKVLVRLDFAQSRGERPKNIRVAPLSGGHETAVKTVWPAPTGNAAMPGISYFAIVDSGPGLRHLDRARVIADIGEAQSGVVIPSAALVVTAGETWCYVETGPQKFERRKVPLTWPVAEGYLVENGFAPGTKVVVRGASTLLSREAEPGDDDDDDDGPPIAKAHPGSDTKPTSDKTSSGADDDQPKAAPQTATRSGTDDNKAAAKDDDDAEPDAAHKKASAAPVTGSTSPARAE